MAEKVEEENTKSSIDDKEVETFSGFMDSWWDKKGPARMLHDMNALRVPFIDECISKAGLIKEEDAASRANVHILDVGCGGGIMTEDLARMGYKVAGIDPSGELIEAAKEHATKEEGLNIAYTKETVEEHSAQAEGKYDAVVVSEVAEHVADTKPLLHACAAALKPGGTMIVTTINRTFLAWFIIILLFEYVLGVAKKGIHQYDRLVKPEEIEEQLKEVNCSVQTVRGMVYVPFKWKWFWIPTLKLNYILVAVKNK